jgi:hypothetical protein
MFQQIKSELVRSDAYYVKRKNGDIVGDLVFDNYNQSKKAVWFYVPNKPYAYLLHLNEIIIYRYVTNEEYLKKRKEKYDQTCLNIVLKQLVNEHFEW